MLKILLKTFLFCVFVFGLYLFIPRNYGVCDFTPREGVQYWDLPSGSKIGYSLINGKGVVRGSPIIYLHGGPGGKVSESHIRFLKPLAEEGHDIYLYDQIGSGHSDRLENIEDYTVQRHKEDLAEIIETIGSEKVILFAHSWGTLLASEYFALHPDKIEKLIYSGPGPMLPIRQELKSKIPPDSLELFQPKFSNREGYEKANNLRNKIIYRWALIFGSKLVSDKEADHFQTFLNQELSKSCTCDGKPLIYKSGDGYYSQVMTVKSFNGVKDKRMTLKGNRTPLLILKGQCDNQSWGYTQEYLDLFANSELHIIKNAGHQIEDSKQEEYIKLIQQFLLK